MDAELEQEVITAIQRGRKVDAIKKLRELRGIGLKEAKELVDSYCSKNIIPTSSVKKTNSGNGFILLIVFGIASYGLYQYFG